MNAATLILAALILVAVAIAAYIAGYRRGRDAEWVREYFARVDRQRAKPRDRDGRFVALKGKAGVP